METLAIYTRARVDEDPRTLIVQEEACRKWAEEKGHTVLHVIRASMWTPQDQGPFRQLLKEIRSDRYEAVVAVEPARFSPIESVVKEIRTEASIHDVRLYTVDPDLEFRDPVNDVLETILARARLRKSMQLPENVVPIFSRRGQGYAAYNLPYPGDPED